jgi:hypothetical protein
MCEGENMPTVVEIAEIFQASDILYSQAKVMLAYGVI